jgi:hypothetical protein
MSETPEHEVAADPDLPGHPSQAEGDDPDRDDTAQDAIDDPASPGHPSQAEGGDPAAAR